MASRMHAIPDQTELPGSRRWRRKAIIAVARDMFFEHGYGSTSMSAVAAQIGGSKTTLWSYFPSKQALFEAVVDDVVSRYGSLIEGVPLPDGNLEETLTRFGRAVLETVVSPEVMSLYRLVVAEAGRFPELGEFYYRKGPGRAELRLTEYLAGEMEAGRVQRGDPGVVARHFLQACQSQEAQKVILNLLRDPPEQAIAGDVKSAVSAFLRAHAGPAIRDDTTRFDK